MLIKAIFVLLVRGVHEMADTKADPFPVKMALTHVLSAVLWLHTMLCHAVTHHGHTHHTQTQSNTNVKLFFLKSSNVYP